MNLTAQELFPGLMESLSPDRAVRVKNILERFFTKTLTRTANGLPFIITGDIPAMWLRDSTWQVAPFFSSKHPEIAELLADLSLAQQKYFLIDPYANAFNPTASGACWDKDFADQSPWVWERKYELDSWASVLFLARKVKECWGITRQYEGSFKEVLNLMIELARREQRHDPDSYLFYRDNGVPHDSLSNGGKGAPVGYTGMVFSAFRPSDDACTYGYLIPSNLFFLNELKLLPSDFRPDDLIAEIESGLREYATTEQGYAYEVDGLGNRLFIDDANIPSLLSLPYLGVCAADDPIYLKTRVHILSAKNQYFHQTAVATGIGSQHTPRDHIWPIAIAVEGLTRIDSSSVDDILIALESTDAGTGLMHESFHKDDPTIFTREWFSWADAMYLEVILKSFKAMRSAVNG